ncbi:MAG: hypothetical protein Q9221_004613 [Calogaya cf. arnoldii]
MQLTGNKEDLRRFHRIHFAPSTSSINVTPQANANYVGNWADSVKEDDLGYYPDGAKRTLTDEQIAMFRHSEIYALQRKRQLRKENQEVDDGFSDSPVDTEIQIIKPEAAVFDSPEQSLDNFMKHYGPGGRNRCDFQTVEEALTNMVNSDGAAGKNTGNITGTRKRRKADDDERRNVNRDTTSRRQARELDDPVADIGFLDYGEESNVIQSIETTEERVKVDYTDYDDLFDFQPDQEAVPPKEGKKIWWPTIG